MKTNHATRSSLTCLAIFLAAGQCLLGCQDKELQPEPKAQNLSHTQVTGVEPLADAPAYFVQIAAFTKVENARKVQSALSGQTYLCTIQKTTVPGGSLLWKVLVGPYNEEAKARTALQALKSQGYHNAFVYVQGKKATAVDSSMRKAKSVTSVELASPDEESIGKQLTESGGCSTPRWSPTGREIAFVKRLPNEEGIYTMGTGGGPHSQIVKSHPGFQISDEFAWAPNGRTVAFVANVVNDEFERVQNLYMIDKTSRTPTALVKQQRNDFSIAALKWSPEGSQLAYEIAYDEPGTQPFTSVSVVSVVAGHAGGDEVDFIKKSQSDELYRLIGWMSENELLLLSSTFDEEDTRHVYEFREYNLASRQLAQVYPGFQMPYCSDLKFVRKTHDVICTETDISFPAKYPSVSVLNLIAGTTQVLVEAQTSDDYLSPVRSANGDLFFIYNEQLWRSTPSESVRLIHLGVNPKDFTISPTGGRICFEEAGNLLMRMLVPK